MASFNYFNYFTEIEEYFWRKRGAHLLVSPLDWAIVETWQKAGIPIDAVLRGIDSAFESYQHSRRAAGRPLKSLAYCVDAVLDAATEKSASATGTGPQLQHSASSAEPISRDDLRAFFARNGQRLERAAQHLPAGSAEMARHFLQTHAKLGEIAALLESPARLDLEEIERRLTVLEEKLTAAMTTGATEEALLEIHRELDRQLAPYRRRMTAEQLAQLERQYTRKRLFERFDLPRLSLFYLT